MNVLPLPSLGARIELSSEELVGLDEGLSNVVTARSVLLLLGYSLVSTEIIEMGILGVFPKGQDHPLIEVLERIAVHEGQSATGV